VQNDPGDSSGRIRFGDFEVDVRSHELLRSGRRIRLQEKSFLVLNELLKSPGRVVTREELAAALWPKEYFVDAEHGLNTAVRRLREALGDSAEEARFVETLPKLGYRFIGAIDVRPEPTVPSDNAGPASTTVSGAPPVSPPGAAPPTSPESEPATTPTPLSPPSPPGVAPEAPAPSFRRASLVAAAILVVVALALAATLVTRSRSARTKAGAASPAPPASQADVVNELIARSRYLRNHKRFAEAKKFVEEALKLDPRNAEALAGLALGLNVEGKDGQGRETARRALELDPNVGEAHRALGALARGAGNFAAAERHFRHAIDADPADYKTRNRLGRHLLECGRFDEAREQFLETRRLAPDDPDVQNIWMDYAFRTGDYESAIREGEIWTAIWEKQLEREGVFGVRDMLGLAYVGARRHEDALRQFRLIDPDNDLRVALALGYAGRTVEARTILDAHERTDAAAGAVADPGLAGAMAMAYVALGDFDRAFEHLDRQLAARWFPGWLNSKLFHPIRRDPRWAAFERRLEREFLGREEDGSAPDGSARGHYLQFWPWPAKGASSAAAAR